MKRLSLITTLVFLFPLAALAQFTPVVTSQDHVSLTGTGNSSGIDWDGNGLFNFLQVGVGVNADFGGYYAYSVDLVDKNGTLLGSQSSFTFISSGSTTFNLFFDGSAIGKNGVNGPYYLDNLTLQNMFGTGSLVAPKAFATQPFLASQFEDYTAHDTTPPVVSVAATPGVLWPVDHKMHEITVDVNATDDTDPSPFVSLLSITSNQGENMLGDGNTSNDIQVQDGRIFLRAERSATTKGDRVYVITYSAQDASGNLATGFATVTVPHNQPSN